MKLKAYLISMAIIALMSVSQSSTAGMKWVDLGVNGLTCSMCTRSVEMSIRRLDFVDTVVMSLESAEGRIYLKSNVPVSFEQLAKAVVNAGFSVRFIKVQFDFNDIEIGTDGTFTYEGQAFKWIDFTTKRIKAQVALKLIDEGFLPKKESGEFKKKLNLYKNSPGQKVLHVYQEG
jgi:copper chaperone CopZ